MSSIPKLISNKKMPTGPGKYDNEASRIREETNAELIILAILGGDKGDGFAIQTTSPAALKRVPDMLRFMADQIDNDV
jgi:hypothetical protein